MSAELSTRLRLEKEIVDDEVDEDGNYWCGSVHESPTRASRRAAWQTLLNSAWEQEAAQRLHLSVCLMSWSILRVKRSVEALPRRAQGALQPPCPFSQPAWIHQHDDGWEQPVADLFPWVFSSGLASIAFPHDGLGSLDDDFPLFNDLSELAAVARIPASMNTERPGLRLQAYKAHNVSLTRLWQWFYLATISPID